MNHLTLETQLLIVMNNLWLRAMRLAAPIITCAVYIGYAPFCCCMEPPRDSSCRSPHADDITIVGGSDAFIQVTVINNTFQHYMGEAGVILPVRRDGRWVRRWSIVTNRRVADVRCWIRTVRNIYMIRHGSRVFWYQWSQNTFLELSRFFIWY